MRSPFPRAILAGLLLALPLGAHATTASVLGELLRHEARLLEQDHAADSRPHTFGSDPYAIIHIPRTRQTLLLLRNASDVMLLDPSLRTSDRKPAPRTPRGWTLVDGQYLWLAGELSNRLVLYRVEPDKLARTAELVLDGSAGLRDVAYVPASNSLFVIDAPRRRLIQVMLDHDWRNGAANFETRDYPIGAGPLKIAYAHDYLFLNLLLDHRVDAIPLVHGKPDFQRTRSVVHEGPIWAFDTARRGDGVLLALAGVEDRELDRTQGEFGYIDSFLFIYELPHASAAGSAPPRRLTSRNLSAQHIVTPKTVRFADERGERLWVIGFGSDRGAAFELTASTVSVREQFRLPPGTTDVALLQDGAQFQLLLPNTLLDQVYRVTAEEEASTARPLEHLSLENSYPTVRSRVGELLFFTTLLSPQNRTEDHLSRFTCETCHFEGTIDGRVHYTGRGKVFATTKTLKGLANNVPLFSRAGDRSLASMVVAEFRVANQNREDDFSIRARDYPWLGALDGVPSELDPVELRKSFLSFFVDFRHAPNPWLATRGRLSEDALGGIGVFSARCEYCHRAVPSTRSDETVTTHEWPALVENEAIDLVWGAPFYTKTNILPYVSTRGARVPSLRRVAEKYPYFTNGSSRHLRDVLERFRYRGATAWHHYDGSSSEEVKALSADEVRQLEALLRYF